MAEDRIKVLVTPPIHATGNYTLYSPYAVSIEMIYRCYAIRSIKELVNRGIDVYTEYYKPVGLGEKVYEADAALGASIVTLISVENEYYYVPNTYIETYPGMGGMRYERKLIALDIGPLPAAFNVNYLLGDLQDIVTKAVGVTQDKAEVTFATIPMSTTVSHADHIQLEATRRAAIQLHTPLEVQLSEQTARADALEEQNATLLEIISAHPELFDEA